MVLVKWRVGGEAADGRQPVPLRSSGTFATANGGFAALLMGSLWVGADGGVLGFRAVLSDGKSKSALHNLRAQNFSISFPESRQAS